jgi:anaerobic magnesium-protoporphyrin IX monomethyl ester cyclase
MAQIVLICPFSSIEATGLRILSACLKEAGFTTRMIFMPDVREAMGEAHYNERFISAGVMQQIVGLCEEALLVGITVMTSSFKIAVQITKHLHISFDIPVVWGGVHPTIRPHECVDYTDLVCIGEGEQTIVDLAQKISRGDDYHDINNLTYRNSNGEIVINPLYPLKQNLDDIPFPDYDFESHFVLHDGEVIPFTQNLMYYYMTELGSWAIGPVYGLLTTRGCPYQCTYCINDTLSEIYPDWNKLRKRSPANVIMEIQAIRKNLPKIEAIIIRDDTFFANPLTYIAEFSRLYQEVGLPFRAYTTAQTADPEKMRHLVKAGLRFVIMGIQTGSERTNKLYQRNVSNEQIIRAAHLIHEFREWIPRPLYDVITDNPYENTDDCFKTLQLIYHLPPPYRLSVYSLTFYPGTKLAIRAKQDRLIEGEDYLVYLHNFQIIKPNYYNLALICHGLNLPRWFLFVLTRRSTFNFMCREPMNYLAGRLLKGLLVFRLWKNQRFYSRRCHELLSEGNLKYYV